MILENFGIRVDLSFDMGVEAENYEEAVQVVKNIFEERHNIIVKDEEIDSERNELLKDLLYHIDTIDEEGFSNYKIKELLKEIVKEIQKGD
jgi:DNA-binding transcriptional regulator YhcF (GntR family)